MNTQISNRQLRKAKAFYFKLLNKLGAALANKWLLCPELLTHIEREKIEREANIMRGGSLVLETTAS